MSSASPAPSSAPAPSPAAKKPAKPAAKKPAAPKKPSLLEKLSQTRVAPKSGNRLMPGEFTVSSVSGGVNKHILIATLGLVTIGVVKKWAVPGSKLTPTLAGGFVFLMVLSVADLAGGQVSKFASVLAMLALVTGLITEFPWSILLNVGSTTNPAAKKAPPS